MAVLPLLAELPPPTTNDAATNSTTQDTDGDFVDPAKFPNLSMTLTGVSPFTDGSWTTFEGEYKNFNQAFYAANPQFGVTELDLLLEFVSQDPPSLDRLRRHLQASPEGELTLVYNLALVYKIAPDSGLVPADVVTQPFATPTSRDAFVALLQESYNPTFDNISEVSGVTQESGAVDSSLAFTPKAMGAMLSVAAAVGVIGV